MKMYKSILAIISFFLIFTSCIKKEEEVLSLKKGIAVITGKIINLNENTNIIRFVAGSIVKDIDQTALIDSSGNFRLEIELYHPQNVQSNFKGRWIKLFLRPSDSLHLVIDETVFVKEEFPIIEIEGTKPDADISKTIQKYARFRGKHLFRPNVKGITEKEFFDILQREIFQQDSILENFCKNIEVSDDFKVWAQKDIRYYVANYIGAYKGTHENINGDFYYESLFPINDDNAIITDLYSTHLKNFAGNIGFLQDTVTLNLLQKGEYIYAYQRFFNKIINNVEKGLSRDIMCYKFLLHLLDESFKDYEIVSKKVDTYIDNKTLKSVLFEKENEYKNKKSLDISYLDPQSIDEKEIIGPFWKELKSKYKGKVVLVDIWATWCAPCIEEIPHAVKLHEYFKGQEIAFVNLCLESNKSDWEKMIESKKIEGDNYFFNTPQTQLLRGKLQFEAYPTYLIIDKQGNLVHRQAPKPSTNEIIKNLLNEWIEKE